MARNTKPIPRNHPVQPLRWNQKAEDKATCGHCGLSWDDGKVTSMTPAPSARCPFEAFHIYKEVSRNKKGRMAEIKTIDPYEGGAIVVTVEGGVIQDIEGIPPGVTVRVLDFDTEGVEENELVVVNDDKQKAIVSEWRCRSGSLVGKSKG